MYDTNTKNGSERSAAVSLASSMTHNAYTRSKHGRQAIDQFRQNTKHQFDYSKSLGTKVHAKQSKRNLQQMLDR